MSEFDATARALAATGRRLWQLGLSPATSSNYSCRLADGSIAITRSGRDKGLLEVTDIMRIDGNGTPLMPGKSSAETALHTQLYRRFPETGAVLHTHSVAATALTMHIINDNQIMLEGYELLKIMPGISTHDTRIVLPIFPNTQDINALAHNVDACLDKSDFMAYLIRGHGLYTWAPCLEQCFHQIEALEHLLEVELLRHQLTR